MIRLFRLSGFILISLFSQQLLGYSFISVTSKYEEIKEGEEGVISYFIQNNHSKPIEDLIMIDSLPKNITLISSNNTVKNDGRFLRFEIGKLEAFESYSFNVTYKFNRYGKVEHRIKNIYTISGEQGVKTENNILYFYIKKNSAFDSKNLRVFFSPNGDGLNDVLVIKGLENYPNNTIEIFNRFNDKIYSTKNYDNSWDGGKAASGNYFYILTIINDGKEEKYSGSILLER